MTIICGWKRFGLGKDKGEVEGTDSSVHSAPSFVEFKNSSDKYDDYDDNEHQLHTTADEALSTRALTYILIEPIYHNDTMMSQNYQLFWYPNDAATGFLGSKKTLTPSTITGHGRPMETGPETSSPHRLKLSSGLRNMKMANLLFQGASSFCSDLPTYDSD